MLDQATAAFGSYGFDIAERPIGLHDELAVGGHHSDVWQEALPGLVLARKRQEAQRCEAKSSN
jgi:hypothetical protein